MNWLSAVCTTEPSLYPNSLLVVINFLFFCVKVITSDILLHAGPVGIFAECRFKIKTERKNSETFPPRSMCATHPQCYANSDAFCLLQKKNATKNFQSVEVQISMVSNVIINNILQLLCLEFPHRTGPLLMWPADGLLSSCFGAEDPGRPNPAFAEVFAFVPVPGADITQQRSSNDKPRNKSRDRQR